jgi:hypothetical protein
MKTHRLAWMLCALPMSWGALAQSPDAEAGLRAVEQLGEANGQALACGENGIVSQARQLMLRHAPRTARFGDAFEHATQAAFLAQVGGKATCPSAAALVARIGVIATTLQATLPAVD